MKSLGGFSSPWHILWTSVHGRSSSFPPGYLRVSCSITALEPCGFPVTLVILKTPSGLLQSPWAPLYIPFPRWSHPYTLWGQQVTSTANGGPGWALTSQSLILTCLGEDAEQLKESWPFPILLSMPSSFLESWDTFKISYFTCSLSRSFKGKIYITFFEVNLLHGRIDNKHGIRKWQLINIWKIADKWLIYLIYAESKVKIRKEYEQHNRRELWSKQEYNEIQITQKKRGQLPKIRKKCQTYLVI